MTDKLKEIAEMEKLLKDNPDWSEMRKWSLQTYICQLKGEPSPPHPLESSSQSARKSKKNKENENN